MKLTVCIAKGCWRTASPRSARHYANGQWAMYCDEHYRPQPGDNASTHTRIQMSYR